MRDLLITLVCLVLCGWAAAQDACMSCHPAPTKGLRATVHGVLLQTDRARAEACVKCHGETAVAHSQSVSRGEKPFRRPEPVDMQTCAHCHEGRRLEPELALHRWLQELPPAPPKVEIPPPARDGQAGRFLGMDWSALARLGVRMVDVGGSRARYDTDLNLDEGFRLAEFELLGAGNGDRFELRAVDIGDPWSRVRAEAERKGLGSGAADWQQSRYAYRASGDYHRVDQKSDVQGYDLAVEINPELEAFAGYARTLYDGYWLTNRIGNTNLTPYTTIGGVQSPRELDSDRIEGGLRGRLRDWNFLVAAEYYDEDARDRWAYAQNSAINPAYPESEDTLSHATLRGPGARASLARKFEGGSLGFSGRWLQRDRKIVGSGLQQGYDISYFNTVTTSDSSGEAETWLADGTLAYDLADMLTLNCDLRWRDHQEDLSIFQTDVTTYPGLGSSTTVVTDLDQHTAQRIFDATVALDWQVEKRLALTGGYGFSDEYLKVPDLEAGDTDYRSGTTRTSGVLGGVRYDPAKTWRLSAEGQNFGSSGLQLYEVVPDEAREFATKARYQDERKRGEVFWRIRQNENEVARSESEAVTFGVSGSATLADEFDLHVAWTHSNLHSRSLTNFYFDPDPNPQPTYVGYRGDTDAVAAGFVWKLSTRTEWSADLSWVDTRGDFDVRSADWRSDFSVEVVRGGRAGLQLRQVDYEESAGADNYDAWIVMIYWQQLLGRAR